MTKLGELEGLSPLGRAFGLQYFLILNHFFVAIIFSTNIYF